MKRTSISRKRLGVIGVNLLYGAFYYHQPEKLIASLQENLAEHRIQVDMIKFSGPAYAGVDNRLMSSQLVSQGLTTAVMFTADGRERCSRRRFFTRKQHFGGTRKFPPGHSRDKRYA